MMMMMMMMMMTTRENNDDEEKVMMVMMTMLMVMMMMMKSMSEVVRVAGDPGDFELLLWTSDHYNFVGDDDVFLFLIFRV